MGGNKRRTTEWNVIIIGYTDKKSCWFLLLSLFGEADWSLLGAGRLALSGFLHEM